MTVGIQETYSWSPLPSPRHTRVAQLKPCDSFKQPIECSIITTSIKEPCKYRALSYSWGAIRENGSHLDSIIYCDGKPMRVTRHLDMALKHIRASTITWYRKLPIWIDAISITQNDPDEKAEQVLMISEIFGRCRHLTIWVGEPGSPEEDALCGSVAAKFNQWEDEGLEVELDCSERRFLDAVLARSWFQRRWIIQEVLVANTSGLTPLFRLGRHVWNWPFMVYIIEKNTASASRENFLLLVHRMVHDSLIPGPFAAARNTAIDLLDASGRPLYNSIIETLHIFEDAQCYDPRDRLFALLSMGWGPGKFDVDYIASVEEVYNRFACTLLHATSDDFLPAVLASASCRRAKGPSSASNLPSWVPDWRNTARYKSSAHRATVERCISQVAGFAINDFHGDKRTITRNNTLALHDVRLLKLCDHMPNSPVTECAFCDLRQSCKAYETPKEEPCCHYRSSKGLDCAECEESNPFAAHALRELALLEAGQFVCLLPKSQMALVLRAAQSPEDAYMIEKCLLIPPSTHLPDFWNKQRALPRCDIAIV